MGLLDYDFRFVEIEYELSILEDYLELIEKQLTHLTEQKREQFEKKIQEEIYRIDEAEYQDAYRQFHEEIEHLLPRFFRNPFLVTLWATFESAVVEFAKFLQAQKGVEQNIYDAKGDNFLKRARKYFDQELKFPLCAKPKIFERLEMLRVLRNAIAHSNSRIDAIKDAKLRSRIKEWIQRKIGISLSWYTLIFSEQFLRENYAVVNDVLTDILNRVRIEYPNKN